MRWQRIDSNLSQPLTIQDRIGGAESGSLERSTTDLLDQIGVVSGQLGDLPC